MLKLVGEIVVKIFNQRERNEGVSHHSFLGCLFRLSLVCFIIIIIIIYYFFLAALGLHCWAQAFSSCGELGLLFVAVRRLLNAVASLVEHRL